MAIETRLRVTICGFLYTPPLAGEGWGEGGSRRQTERSGELLPPSPCPLPPAGEGSSSICDCPALTPALSRGERGKKVSRSSVVRSRGRRGRGSRVLPSSWGGPRSGPRCGAAIWLTSRNRGGGPRGG